MIPKVDEYIMINNQEEWIEIQKYLFNLGYIWCDNTQEIIQKCKYCPDYILIETNHLNKNNNLMFSYGHLPYKHSIVHDANKFICKIIRKEKINKISNGRN